VKGVCVFGVEITRRKMKGETRKTPIESQSIFDSFLVSTNTLIQAE